MIFITKLFLVFITTGHIYGQSFIYKDLFVGALLNMDKFSLMNSEVIFVIILFIITNSYIYFY